MAGQDRISRRSSEEELPEPLPPTSAATPNQQATVDLLAEIDGVLEENAEEFVKGFVQKGGQ